MEISRISFSILPETESLTTDFEMCDNHLRSEDIFNSEKIPTMTFKITSLTKHLNSLRKDHDKPTIVNYIFSCC
jgi:polyisoprenoid-binding protein YceI